MAVPILTAGAESAAAKANGLATMNRGAVFTVGEVRDPRGMPCAASGDSTEAPTTAQSRRDGTGTFQSLHRGLAPKGRQRPRDARRRMGEEGFEPPTSCV